MPISDQGKSERAREIQGSQPTHRQADSTSAFVDTRLATTAQHQHQALTQNSARSHRLQEYAALAAASPRVSRLTTMRDSINASTRVIQQQVSPSTSGNVTQLHRPHERDVGRQFLINGPTLDSAPSIGEYVGSAGETYTFSTSRGRIFVTEDRIVGYRHTVSGLHPPGITRPPEANLRGRRSVFLSEGDLSGAVARQRRAPALVNDMVVSTYEPTPDYPNYEPNRITLEGLGVPILNSMDISNIDDTAQRLSGIGHGANIHFQMPRVPRIPGYSTQQLIRHTLSLPSTMDREDLSVSITAPHPEMYGLPGTHNRIYGLENSNAVVGTNMERYEAATDSDEELEEFGYEHKESTKNKSAEAAKKRKKYKFQTLGNEHSNIKRDPGAPPPDDDNVGETLAPD